MTGPYEVKILVNTPLQRGYGHLHRRSPDRRHRQRPRERPGLRLGPDRHNRPDRPQSRLDADTTTTHGSDLRTHPGPNLRKTGPRPPHPHRPCSHHSPDRSRHNTQARRGGSRGQNRRNPTPRRGALSGDRRPLILLLPLHASQGADGEYCTRRCARIGHGALCRCVHVRAQVRKCTRSQA